MERLKFAANLNGVSPNVGLKAGNNEQQQRQSNRQGTRIPKMYLENVNVQEIMQSLDGLIERWARERKHNEAFGDFLIRNKVVPSVVDSAKDFYS